MPQQSVFLKPGYYPFVAQATVNKQCTTLQDGTAYGRRHGFEVGGTKSGAKPQKNFSECSQFCVSGAQDQNGKHWSCQNKMNVKERYSLTKRLAAANRSRISIRVTKTYPGWRRGRPCKQVRLT